MEITNSPVADWSKEEQYNNWFSQFDDIGHDNDEGFEVIDQSEIENLDLIRKHYLYHVRPCGIQFAGSVPCPPWSTLSIYCPIIT